MKLELGRKWVLKRVLSMMASRPPDFLVGDPQDPQLKRWWIIPKNPLFAIYAHQFCKDDGDVPHDHPYFNITWALQIGYIEYQFLREARKSKRFTPDYRTDLIRREVNEGQIVTRWAKRAHRVELKRFVARTIAPGERSFILSNGEKLEQGELQIRMPHPISLFFCGPRFHSWGFYCPQGFRPYKQYIAEHSYGNRIGKGCED